MGVAFRALFCPMFLIGPFVTSLLVILFLVSVLAFLLVVASLAGVFFFSAVLGPRLGGALVTLLLVPVFLVAVLEAAAFFAALFGFDIRSVPGNSYSYRTRGGGSLEFAERVSEAKIPGRGGFALLGSILPELKVSR